MQRRIAFFAPLLAALCVPIAADAKKTHPGPCRQGQVVSIVDRPGAGAAPITSGSPCTVPKHHVVVEAGYRNEVDAGPNGTSILSAYPLAVIRAGLDKRDEVVVQAPALSIRSGSALPSFSPAIGTQDFGIGIKHAIKSRWFYQDAVEAFVTAATGTHGYSAGGPAWSLAYVGSISPPGKFTLSATASFIDAPGTPPAGPPRRFASFQPSLTLAYALSSKTSVMVNDNLAFPAAPSAGSGNSLLVALQRALSPGVVVDVESESNLLPISGFRQHAVGFGGAFMF